MVLAQPIDKAIVVVGLERQIVGERQLRLRKPQTVGHTTERQFAARKD